MNKFEELETTKLGEYGESLVNQRLMNKFFIFTPEEGPHAFDLVCVNRKTKEMVYGEVKTKARMQKYPTTGIDEADFIMYNTLEQQNGIQMTLFFVDWITMTIYGGKLQDVSKDSYVLPANDRRKVDIRVFKIEHMVDYATLTEEEVGKLKELQHSNY